MSEQKTPAEQRPTTAKPVTKSATPTSAPTPAAAASSSSYRLPGDATLKHAAKLSIVEDKPIMMDYWTASLEKKALVGARDNGEKLLVKSEEEYTSTIAKFYKSGDEYIIMTENSIYLVDVSIPTRKIS